MAQRVDIQLSDDLDGTDFQAGKGETLTFALDGHTYEIDLTNKNAGALRKILSPYVSAGRRVKTSRSGRGKRAWSGPSANTAREWARANGYEVNDRGRIPANVREAFVAAN